MTRIRADWPFPMTYAFEVGDDSFGAALVEIEDAALELVNTLAVWSSNDIWIAWAEVAKPAALDCGYCGRSPATGHAAIGSVRYCHGDADSSPTCYETAVMTGIGLRRSDAGTLPSLRRSAMDIRRSAARLRRSA